ncbi:hypothetical protein EV44_g5964 [Erysiphe necator]|uniref:Uncharacterized protein n=1 Tax=Uncinula necator TaxID=52586 RepID=A0A0B1P955_UNCNE|nr:hypothetical protein EV44_g5964 [Erysiphe necator]
MTQFVRCKYKAKSNSSSRTISHQSYGSYLSKRIAPSTQEYMQTQNSVHAEDCNSSLSTLDVTHSPTETYVDSNENIDVVGDESPVYCIYPSFQELKSRVITTELRATNSTNFAEHFPSSRILSICHDVLSSDNHMNLRVDTEDINHRGMVQLFHLRLQDVQMRQSSLRRYERNSGREICKTSRKLVPATPMFPRSVSTALAHIKLPSSPSNLLQKFWPDTSSHWGISTKCPQYSINSSSNHIESNIIRLEFSNYAQVEIKCRSGRRLGKRYEFEYWGNNYAWKRVGKREAKYKGVSYHLHRAGHASAVAYIVPELQNQWQQYQERKAGNWVPPCGMWIAEAALTEGNDVADVIIATGLMALVDDNIAGYLDDSSSLSRPLFGRPIYEPLVPLLKQGE